MFLLRSCLEYDPFTFLISAIDAMLSIVLTGFKLLFYLSGALSLFFDSDPDAAESDSYSPCSSIYALRLISSSIIIISSYFCFCLI